MTGVACLFVEQRLPQQLRCEGRFRLGILRVDEVCAVAAVRYRAAGSDDADGIRIHADVRHFKEEGQIFRLHRDAEGVIVHQPHAAEIGCFPRVIRFVAHDVLGSWC